MMDEAEAMEQVNLEMAQMAAQRASNRARVARWDLDVAVFFFAVLIILIILLFQGIGIVIVAPSATCGLALGWLMGWKKGKQLYQGFYDEELSKLEQELRVKKIAEGTLEETVDEMIQKALRERLR